MLKFLKKIPLHTQILLALVFGALFGAFFSVDQHKLKLKYSLEERKTETVEIKDWENFTYDFSERSGLDDVTYNEFSQIRIIKKFEKLKPKEKKDLKIKIEYKDGETETYTNIRKIDSYETIATQIKPLGTLFINLLSFLAIPLVLASLIVGAASLDDIKKIGRIGGKTFGIYMVTTAIAITIGLSIANIMSPGTKVPEEERNRLMGAYQEESEEFTEEFEVDIVDFFLDIVPRNPFNAISKGNMIQIVFLAVFFGITLTLIGKDKSKPVLDFFKGVSDTMVRMVEIVMKIAPYGVFALIAATISNFGFGIITTLLWYIIAVIVGLLLQTFIVYGSLVKFVGKFSLRKFFKGIRNAQAIAFSTSSSAATLPVTLDCVENNLGVRKEISGFVLPLGATINMDGTALYQGVAAMFIAQIYGIDLQITEQITIVITAVLASIGTAPVPGVGIIMLVMILQSVNIPPQGIALILGVDRILDMMRTITNITGDSAVSVAVNGTEK